MTRISASILGFLFDAKKNKESSELMVKKINLAIQEKKNHFDILHLDIEDGVFVKHKSFTPKEIRALTRSMYLVGKKVEAHFMVVNYQKYLKEYYNLADMFIFHEEVLKRDFGKTIENLKRNGKHVGICINPNTSVYDIKYLDKIDLVLVMSVYPGLPGQKFIDTSLMKVRRLKELRRQKRYNYQIEIDGGVNDSNIKKCITAGADIVVMGTGLFKKK